MYDSTRWTVVHASSRPTIDLAALQTHLTDDEIETICLELGHRWRVRIFTPPVTVRSIVYRGLHPDKAIEAVMIEMAANAPLTDPPTDTAWCSARNRLPEAVLDQLVKRSAQRLIDRFGGDYLYWGRPVYRFDGTTVSMPDTPELVDHFGYANTKHGLSRFPDARVGVWIAAGSEAICDLRIDPYRTSEIAQLRASWDCLPRRAICVYDVKFSNFYDLAKLRQRRVDVITPLHQRRDANKLIAAGRKIGRNQGLVPLKLSPKLRKDYDDPSLPQTLWVRLIHVRLRGKNRRRSLWLVTTLLNPQRYDARTIAALYRDRWTIETRIGMFKVTLAAKVLRSRTVDGVRKELLGRALAYNLVCTVIHDAAAEADVKADRISFIDAARTIITYSPALRGHRGPARQAIYRHMLTAIATHINPDRPDRKEPRLVKRELRRYGFWKEPRAKAKLRL